MALRPLSPNHNMVQLVFFSRNETALSYYTEAPKYYTTKGKKMPFFIYRTLSSRLACVTLPKSLQRIKPTLPPLTLMNLFKEDFP
jgi:hypothetical protein